MLKSSINHLAPLPYRHDDNCSIGTIGGNRMPDAIAPHACSFSSSADYELSLILKEIRFITDQVSFDWKVAGEPFTNFRFHFRSTDSETGRRLGSSQGVEVCRHGGRQNVPFYFYVLYDRLYLRGNFTMSHKFRSQIHNDLLFSFRRWCWVLLI